MCKGPGWEQALRIWEQKAGSFGWSDLDEELEIGSVRAERYIRKSYRHGEDLDFILGS